MRHRRCSRSSMLDRQAGVESVQGGTSGGPSGQRLIPAMGPMETQSGLPTAKDKTLFTPGPLTTSLSVKQAMLHDAGSWHFEFNTLVKSIREKLLALAGVSREEGYEAILLQ